MKENFQDSSAFVFDFQPLSYLLSMSKCGTVHRVFTGHSVWVVIFLVGFLFVFFFSLA